MRKKCAIVWALKSLRNYLYGGARIRIFTDHRWKATLEEYNCILQYKSGKANAVADALSKHPQEICKMDSTAVTQHSNQSSPENSIQYTETPINAFKNQIIPLHMSSRLFSRRIIDTFY